MNITTSNTQSNISCSDNSHIFGIPIRLSEGLNADIDIPILDENGRRSFDGLGEWGRKVAFLERAGIEIHFHYV